MNHKYFLFSFLGCIVPFLCGCASKSHNKEGNVSLDTLTIDSIVVDTVFEATVEYILENFPDDPPFIKGVVEMPLREQNPVLADSFAVWVYSEYGKLDASEMQAGIPSITKAYLIKHGGVNNQFTFAIRKVYENANIVSFEYEFDLYCYGVHGIQARCGASFLKESGKRLGWNMFKDDVCFQPFLKKGLEAYCEVDDLRETRSYICQEVNVDNLPLPSATPWVEKNGIRFLYGNYEISSYAGGLPTFVVPIEDAKEILTPDAYKLLR